MATMRDRTIEDKRNRNGKREKKKQERAIEIKRGVYNDCLQWSKNYKMYNIDKKPGRRMGGSGGGGGGSNTHR